MLNGRRHLDVDSDQELGVLGFGGFSMNYVGDMAISLAEISRHRESDLVEEFVLRQGDDVLYFDESVFAAMSC